MPHNQKSLRKLMEDHGWACERGGNHVVKMTKVGHRPVTLPKHKGCDYGKGLESSILKQAGLK